MSQKEQPSRLLEGTADGNLYPMKGARDFTRKTKVRAVRMLVGFVVQNRDTGVQKFRAGDFLLEQNGVRWGVPYDSFAELYELARS